AGDLDGDAFDEPVTGAGPGAVFAPVVRGWNYDAAFVRSIAKVNFLAFGVNQYGVNVACGDVEADGFAEMACGPGPGPGASFPGELRGFDFDGSQLASLSGFTVTAFT